MAEFKFERKVTIEEGHVTGKIHNDLFYLTALWTEHDEYWGSDFSLAINKNELDQIIKELTEIRKQMDYDFKKLEVE